MYLVFFSPVRILLLTAGLAGLMFYLAAGTADPSFHRFLLAIGSALVFIALVALRWILRGIVVFFR